MRLDRSLGNVQISCDFRVVASLEKQINNLPFPGLHPAEILFHKHRTSPLRPGRWKWQSGPAAHWIRVFSCLILHSGGQSRLRLLTNCEIFPGALFSWKTAVTTVIACTYAQQFYSTSRVNRLVQTSMRMPSKDHIYTEVHPRRRSASSARSPALPYNEPWTSSW